MSTALPRSAPQIAHRLLPVLLLLLLIAFFPSPALSVNVTELLAAHPDLSAFSRLLVATSVADDLSRRSSLTLLAVPNSVLLRAASSPPSSASAGDLNLRAASSPYDLADVLRYHVLLQYLSLDDLREIPPEGKLFTTLYQTTGRAPSNLGDVNLTRAAGGAVTVRAPVPFSPSNASILGFVAALPYNISVFTVDALIIPYGFDLAASENRPPMGLNISRVLVDGRDFNVAASMLEASGVAGELEDDERGAGITVFVPTDEAFAELPRTERLQSLPADRKAVVLRFHVLHSYYPLGSLESIVNPVQPTLATEDTGAGRFTLNITRVNGSVAIDTGIVQASITRTVFDQNPVAVFAVSRVLLPREIFAGGGAEATVVGAPPPELVRAFSPEGVPRGDGSVPESSPAGSAEESRSGGKEAAAAGGGILLLCCIGILHLLLV
ncbi:hypothetical protein Taro_052761 [Colocasia esculenta]|uniref:FAS1 domain-containing protein n=1 Tax=Colocasia esculenta TaxID=4460 RepID=A0A843XJH8_COLES|nr:hypothetical protein [Colocasia esculenta]